MRSGSGRARARRGGGRRRKKEGGGRRRRRRLVAETRPSCAHLRPQSGAASADWAQACTARN
eukprot:3225639-Pyramimonas_sp.AAC.1